MEILKVVAIDEWINKSVEYIGSKAKSWFLNSSLRDDVVPGLYLFKEPKPGTGEDWSELIAYHVAKSLGIPCAEYEFATLKGKRGVISKSIVPPVGELVVGTEYVEERVPGYTTLGYFKRSPHTLDLLWEILEYTCAKPPIGFRLPPDVSSANEVFIGYLMLDALVGNGDRHDENWALIRLQAEYMNCFPGLYLAPTYDHAACLGRELPDAEKELRIKALDRNKTIDGYFARNRSAFFLQKHR